MRARALLPRKGGRGAHARTPTPHPAPAPYAEVPLTATAACLPHDDRDIVVAAPRSNATQQITAYLFRRAQAAEALRELDVADVSGESVGAQQNDRIALLVDGSHDRCRCFRRSRSPARCETASARLVRSQLATVEQILRNRLIASKSAGRRRHRRSSGCHRPVRHRRAARYRGPASGRGGLPYSPHRRRGPARPYAPRAPRPEPSTNAGSWAGSATEKHRNAD